MEDTLVNKLDMATTLRGLISNGNKNIELIILKMLSLTIINPRTGIVHLFTLSVSMSSTSRFWLCYSYIGLDSSKVGNLVLGQPRMLLCMPRVLYRTEHMIHQKED